MRKFGGQLTCNNNHISHPQSVGRRKQRHLSHHIHFLLTCAIYHSAGGVAPKTVESCLDYITENKRMFFHSPTISSTIQHRPPSHCIVTELMTLISTQLQATSSTFRSGCTLFPKRILTPGFPFLLPQMSLTILHSHY